jgi:hypothetical protein
MSDASRPPDAGSRPDREANAGLRRWLYLAGIVGAILILGGVVFHLAGASFGDHGPHRHAPPDDAGGHTHPSEDKNHTPPFDRMKGHTPPAGFHGHGPPEGGHK